MTFFRSAVLVTLLLGLAGPEARAEEAPPPPRHFLVVESYAFSGTIGGRSRTMVSPAVFTSLGVFERINLDAGWVFAFSSSAGEGPTVFQAGNPFVGASSTLMAGTLQVRVGGALALPFTLLTEPDAEQTAVLLHAAALRGNNGFGLVAPGLLSLVPWSHVSWRNGPLQLGLDARVPMSLQTSSELEQTVDVVLQTTGSASVDILPSLLVGTSLQFVYVTTMPEGVDPSFLSLAPFVRLHGRAGFAELKLNLNLDAPLGFAFSPGGVWALGMSLGTGF